jgi:hypothetical protein
MPWTGIDTSLVILSTILYVLLGYLYFYEKYKMNNKMNILFIILAICTFISSLATAINNMLRMLDHNKYEYLWLFRIRTFLTAFFSFSAGIIFLIFMDSNKYNKTLFSF